MKVKTTKTYSLSEETLEKDIDKFILDAKGGLTSTTTGTGRKGSKR